MSCRTGILCTFWLQLSAFHNSYVVKYLRHATWQIDSRNSVRHRDLQWRIGEEESKHFLIPYKWGCYRL